MQFDATVEALEDKNTKLVLRVRELEADREQILEQMAKVQAVTAPLVGRVTELEQDGKRLDWLEENWKQLPWDYLRKNLKTRLRNEIDKAWAS